MKKNQIVTIYEDPFTQQHIEGQAKLLKKIREDNTFETWTVRFDGNLGEPIVERKILKEDLSCTIS